MEFIGYRILYLIYSENRSGLFYCKIKLILKVHFNLFVFQGLESLLKKLKKLDSKDEVIDHALRVRRSWALRNYYTFFHLYKNAPKMSSFLMNWFVSRERKRAFFVFIKAWVKNFFSSFHLTSLFFPTCFNPTLTKFQKQSFFGIFNVKR